MNEDGFFRVIRFKALNVSTHNWIPFLSYQWLRSGSNRTAINTTILKPSKPSTISVVNFSHNLEIFSLFVVFFSANICLFSSKQRILFNRCIERLHVMGFHVSQNETHFCRYFRMKWKQTNVRKSLKNRPILEKYLHWAIFFLQKNVGCLFLAKRN